MRSETPDAVADVLEKHKASAEVAEVVLVASTNLEGGPARSRLDPGEQQGGEGEGGDRIHQGAGPQLPEDEKLALLKVAVADAGDLELRRRKVADMAGPGC